MAGKAMGVAPETPSDAAVELLDLPAATIAAYDLSFADATLDAIKPAVGQGRLPRARLHQAVAALLALPSI